jgi:hypothetical protein
MNKQNIEIKVFIQDKALRNSYHYESITRWINLKTKNCRFRTIVSEEEILKNIPRGYDLYLIHIGDLRGDDFKNIKQEQPWSRIIGISNGGHYEFQGISTDYGKYFDKIYSCRLDVTSEEIKNDFISFFKKQLRVRN